MDKCTFCRKKTLLGVKCKCGSYLCIKHRHPEDHNCRDLKKIMDDDRERLVRDLIGNKVETPKVEKI